MLTSAKLRGLGVNRYMCMCNVHMRLLMCVYLRTKFGVSSVIPMCFREVAYFYQPNPSTAKPIPKNPTQIRVKNLNY